MSASVQAARRARVLHALGLTPWVRRAATGAAVAPAATEPTVDQAGVACVVILPASCSARELDLLGRALHAGGAVLARAARLSVQGGQLEAPVPAAHAYLVFGDAQAHALGRALPAAVMSQAQIVLADEPGLVLADAAAKRRLWNALRSVRRALPDAGG
jgi:hypothetical protein